MDKHVVIHDTGNTQHTAEEDWAMVIVMVISCTKKLVKF